MYFRFRPAAANFRNQTKTYPGNHPGSQHPQGVSSSNPQNPPTICSTRLTSPPKRFIGKAIRLRKCGGRQSRPIALALLPGLLPATPSAEIYDCVPVSPTRRKTSTGSASGVHEHPNLLHTLRQLRHNLPRGLDAHAPRAFLIKHESDRVRARVDRNQRVLQIRHPANLYPSHNPVASCQYPVRPV